MSSTVSVFGLGYVGCVSAACFAKEGHTVIGVDANPAKVEMINAGTSTIVEVGIGELVADMVGSGRLRATLDPQEAVHQSSISLICVGTPSRPNGSIDLSYIERVCGQIGQALRTKAQRHTVVVRSTVLPGTIDCVVIPALQTSSGKVAGQDFGVCMNPEFLREGTSIQDFYDPPFTLIGTDDRDSAEAVSALYAGINGGSCVHVTRPRVAEMVKYACNCFHGLKVAFANEIGGICKAQGVDSHEVMRFFCEDTKLNISPKYLRPGFAFGGSCLPKDLRGILYRAKQLDVETPVLGSILESNRKQIVKAYDMVLATGCRRVGVLGLSFKEGTDDLRESPLVSLIEMLIGKGLNLAIYDRDVSRARLIGSNREYIEREIPHIWTLMRGSVQEVLEHAELVIIGNNAKEFRGLDGSLKSGQNVLDLVRAMTPPENDGAYYQGISW
jgi:GDP-mannose 6-dehydrogenase